MVKQRKWNALLTLMSLIGGLLGFFIGEIILNQWEGRMHETLLIGLYFGQFALVVGLFCLIAEIISPRLNGNNWRLRYAGDGWKMLVPGTLVLLFVAGALFQFIYGFSLEKKDTPKDYVILLDMSESMKETDPDKQSIQAAQSFIQRMDSRERAALFTFNEGTKLNFPLTKVADAGVKAQLSSKLAAVDAPSGQTDIGNALNTVMDYLHKEGDPSRRVAVILISDGYNEVNYSKVLAPYIQERVRVHTVGIVATEVKGNEILTRIANETGGTFQNVQRVDRISLAFEQIYDSAQHRHLLNERVGESSADSYYAILRMILIMLLGTLLGLSLGIVFDNRYLAKSFMIGGTVAGLLAGVILENGLHGAEYPSVYRAFADVVLALVLSLSTMIVAVRQNEGGNSGLRGGRRGLAEREQGRFGNRGDSPVGKRFR
ncbi:vWA domain-containing protein [Paenibacillus sp. UNC451MF]|uniref:vWA domain-containing protein n=1 Tax=Paenibacillus sp. UNC451MF TaxID=1449063 RepID=UPI0007E8E3DC|nr:vWA domain-containing protein [Paenibacillus sp. UNC451MF]